MKAIRRNAGGAAVELIVNIALPYVVYVEAQRRFGDVNALLLSTIPPVVWSLAEFARKRRVDAMSLLVLAGIALSLFAMLGGGSVKFLQLRENLVTGAVGLAFLISAAIGKPLMYMLVIAGAKRRSPEAASSLEALRENVGFRSAMRMMTIVWGAGMLVQTALSCVLVFALSIGVYLILSPILGYGTIGALLAWTFWYIRRRQRLGNAMER
jgi:hypothetical protein